MDRLSQRKDLTNLSVPTNRSKSGIKNLENCLIEQNSIENMIMKTFFFSYYRE